MKECTSCDSAPFGREALEILAIQCFGKQASAIIHIGQTIMRQPPPANTIQYCAATTFNDPTPLATGSCDQASGLAD